MDSGWGVDDATQGRNCSNVRFVTAQRHRRTHPSTPRNSEWWGGEEWSSEVGCIAQHLFRPSTSWPRPKGQQDHRTAPATAQPERRPPPPTHTSSASSGPTSSRSSRAAVPCPAITWGWLGGSGQFPHSLSPFFQNATCTKPESHPGCAGMAPNLVPLTPGGVHSLAGSCWLGGKQVAEIPRSFI